MKSNFAIKALSIIAISMVLLFVLELVEFKVSERNHYRTQAKSTIAEGWSGSQLVVPPIIQLTLSENYVEEVFDKNLKAYVNKNRTRTWKELHIADDLSISGKIIMQERYRGIYKIPVYEAALSIEGIFPKIVLNKGTLLKAELLSSFQDMRGLSSTPDLNWGEYAAPFQTGKDSHLLGNYVSADITKMAPLQGGRFKMQTKLRGLDDINFVPAAKQVSLLLESGWQHPYFRGRYLPESRNIDETGFKAHWSLSEFATSIAQSINQCQKTRSECYLHLNENTFGVGLHSPIDVYQKTDRSLKYGFLFILLTFTIFCLFETLKRIQIHPIQYGLVGAALALFYLLLISLSEHINFASAYALATLACVGLIWFYLKFIFKNKASSSVVALGMTALYGMLYMILRSEDFALLMGSVLTFLSLAALMIATRKIDWYALGKKEPMAETEHGSASPAEHQTV